MSQYLFSEPQITLFKQQAHVIRNALILYKKDKTPSVTKMQDIWAKCLDYPDYQIFIRQSKGHRETFYNPVFLTEKKFIELADALFSYIGKDFSIEKCRWAIAGLFNMDGKHELSMEDIDVIQNAWVNLTPVDDRKQRLIDLELLIVETESFEHAPELGSFIKDYKSTKLGKYVAGIALERLEGHPLTHIDLVRLGLDEHKLCRLRLIGTAVNISWGNSKSPTP